MYIRETIAIVDRLPISHDEREQIYWRNAARAAEAVADAMRTRSVAGVVYLVLAVAAMAAQTVRRVVPRPPAPGPGETRGGQRARPTVTRRFPQWPRPDARAQAGEDRRVRRRDGRRRTDRRDVSSRFFPTAASSSASVPAASGSSERTARSPEPLDGHAAEPVGARRQGLFDVRPDRAFATNRTLYLTYTVLPDGADPAALPRSPGVLMVASATAVGRRQAPRGPQGAARTPKAPADGVIQAPDGTLLVTSTIPAGLGINSVDWPQPQQLDSNMGKVLRINADGSIPKDNPFAGRAGAHPEIYALGFRDVQGVAIHPRTGTLWTSEHGPRGGDEINAVAKGRNYGFPAIGYGREYTGKPINGDKTAQAGMEQPVYFWTPDIAPAGIGFYTGKLLSGVAGRSVRVGARGRSRSFASCSTTSASSARNA